MKPEVVEDLRLTPHFRLSEFRCRCCGAVDTAAALRIANTLERIRRRFNRPMHINSGYRCPKQNRLVGGAQNSAHLHGLAADVELTGGMYRFALTRAAIAEEVKRLGLYQQFIHLDIDDSLPQEVVWIGLIEPNGQAIWMTAGGDR